MIACGECGAPMVLRETKRFRYGDGTPRKFYGCTRFPDCKGTHGAHPDGKPVGVPGDAATKAARSAAHAAFEEFRARNRWSKGKAYRWLQHEFMLTKEEAHIGKFDAEMCRRVERACREGEER